MNSKRAWKCENNTNEFSSALKSVHLLLDYLYFSLSSWWQEREIRSRFFCLWIFWVNTSRWCSLFLMFPSFDIRQETKRKIFLDSVVMRVAHKKTRYPLCIANYTNTSEQGGRDIHHCVNNLQAVQTITVIGKAFSHVEITHLCKSESNDFTSIFPIA